MYSRKGARRDTEFSTHDVPSRQGSEKRRESQLGIDASSGKPAHSQSGAIVLTPRPANGAPAVKPVTSSTAAKTANNGGLSGKLSNGSVTAPSISEYSAASKPSVDGVATKVRAGVKKQLGTGKTAAASRKASQIDGAKKDTDLASQLTAVHDQNSYLQRQNSALSNQNVNLQKANDNLLEEMRRLSHLLESRVPLATDPALGDGQASMDVIVSCGDPASLPAQGCPGFSATSR